MRKKLKKSFKRKRGQKEASMQKKERWRETFILNS